MTHVEFTPVAVPRDHEALANFLAGDEWPFHGRRLLTANDIAVMEFATADVASFWISDQGETVGLVRVMDLGDIGEGAPLFDLRIAGRHRGRGLGTQATRWIVDHLFSTYPELHRIEANTRHDNHAMQRVLTKAGFTLEGRLREAWPSGEGHWLDTMIFGVLRTDHTD